MIACFIEDIEPEEIEVTGESFVHLNSSLRVKEGDSVLILNGKGNKRLSTVKETKKRSIILEGGSIESETRKFNIDLLLSPPKRDALNDCLRFAAEIGIRKIFLFESEFCQNKKVDEERSNKVLRAAIIQSNNPFMPEIVKLGKNLNVSDVYEKALVFHLNSEETEDKLEINGERDYLLAIGPEGGFSTRDIEQIKENIENSKLLKLKTPILRAPTALCVASGWLLSRI